MSRRIDPYLGYLIDSSQKVDLCFDPCGGDSAEDVLATLKTQAQPSHTHAIVWDTTNWSWSDPVRLE